ncbi:hypothetical protein BC793_124110 [Actinoplanes xinjiangensis]|uniref:PH (Pleckstrin Homology) domain-containing protein n=1 Tax=Actinoplanes xinjiangensis TaxID=512350 RepID=A0A316EXQ2_9ACTN|nr:hypothetical protein BC793_124110 [Actinoplanes xinjiangensis]GIF42865.1 hypothetical protein Axi01nite_71760 [Actinoplanes xinjiangensis]
MGECHAWSPLYTPPVSVRTARLLAVPFVVLAFVLRLAEVLWFRPLLWRLDSFSLHAALGLAAIGAALAGPLGAYFLLTRRVRSQPATWHLDPGARSFSVGPSHATGYRAVFIGWAAAGLILVERVPFQEHMRIADEVAPSALTVPLAVLALLLAIAFIMADRRSVTLDEDGVTLQGWLRRARIRWVDPMPWQLTVHARRGSSKLIIEQSRTSTSGSAQPRWIRIPAQWMHIEPGFLAFTLSYYIGAPGSRHGIGTEAELKTLIAAHHGVTSSANQVHHSAG